MNLSRSAQLLVVRFEELFFGTELSTTDSMQVVITIVLLDFADREIAVRVLLRDRDSVINSLLPLAVG